VHTGEPADPAVQKTRSSGNGLMRSLEVAAKKSRCADPARTPNDPDLPAGSELRHGARHRGRPQRHPSENEMEPCRRNE